MATITYCSDITEDVAIRLERLGLEGLISALPVARLAGIYFMGLLGRENKSPHQSRFHHSVAVAGLVLRILERTGLPEVMIRHAASAALLHDASQWALSHSCEGAFARLTGFNNGRIIHAMIFEEPALPPKYHLGKLLDRISIDRNRLWMILDRRQQRVAHRSLDAGWGLVLDLFTCPLHPDTIDGITRACEIFNVRCPSREALADCFEYRAGSLGVRRTSLELIDDFWHSKATVYIDKIHNTSSISLELRYSLAVAEYFAGTSLGGALDLDDAMVLKAVEHSLPRLTSKTATQGYKLRFRKPRRYFIDHSALEESEFILASDLGLRYKSSAIA